MATDNEPLVDAKAPGGVDIPLLEGILRLTRLAWRRKPLILLGVVLAVGLGWLFCLFVQPVYTSEAQALVERKRPRNLPMPGVDRQFSFFQDSLRPHANLLTSPLIAGQAIEQGNLTALKTLAKPEEEESDDFFFSPGKLVDYVRSFFPAYSESTVPSEYDPVEILILGLKVTRETKDGVLEDRSVAVFNISYNCVHQEECSRILEAVIGAYESYLDETQRSDTDEMREMFVQWKGDIQQQLADAEKKYQDLLSKVKPLQWQSEGGVNLSEKRVADLAQQRLARLVDLSQDTERLDSLKKAREEGLRNEVLYDLVTTWNRSVSGEVSERGRLFELLLQQKALQKTFGPMHREVEALRDQIEIAARQVLGPAADIDKLQMMDPVEAYIQSLDEHIKVNGRMVESLEKLIEEEHTRAKEAHILNVQLEQLEADVNLARRLETQIVNQLQELDVNRQSDAVVAQLLSPPSPGRLTTLSKPFVILFLAGCLGVVLGLAMVLFAETMNRSFHSPDEFRQQLHLPVLGHIPYQKISRAAKRQARLNGTTLAPVLVTYHAPLSADAEAYRAVRAALFYSVCADGTNVIQITSPVAGEGKSSLAANLAISMAQSGKRVLLIEADFRRPTFPTLFGLLSKRGLAGVLTAEAEVDDAIQQTSIPGLDLLPCGAGSKGPGEELASPRFKQMLEWAAEKYDYVLVDTPPLLAVADPSAVAAQVDGVLLVLRNTRKAQSMAEQALDRLNGVGARVLGVVVKSTKHAGGSGGYGYEGPGDWLRYSSKYKYETRETEQQAHPVDDNGDGIEGSA